MSSIKRSVGPISYTKNNVNSISSFLCGIYVIYDMKNGGSVFYVGRAKGTSGSDIKARLSKHLDGSDRQVVGALVSERPNDFFFSYAVFNTYADACEAEQAELARLRPPSNFRFGQASLREIRD